MPAVARPRPPDNLLFYSLCALLVWLPLPLGSNRVWAWSIMELWVFLLMAAWCWLYFSNRIALPAGVRAARPVLWLFGLWLVYVGLQLVPLPLARHWASRVGCLS